MSLVYLAIDNGISGSIAWVNDDCSESGVFEMPTFSEQDFTQKKHNVTRINTDDLRFFFHKLGEEDIKGQLVRVILERPFVNPGMFRATLSAIRAWEATLIVLEDAFIWPRIVVDSKKWQKEMLPKGCKGPELKTASVQVGCRLFPNHAEWIVSHGDADSLLLAEAARRNRW